MTEFDLQVVMQIIDKLDGLLLFIKLIISTKMLKYKNIHYRFI